MTGRTITAGQGAYVRPLYAWDLDKLGGPTVQVEPGTRALARIRYKAADGRTYYGGTIPGGPAAEVEMGGEWLLDAS